MSLKLLTIFEETLRIFQLGAIPNTKKNNNQEKSNIFNNDQLSKICNSAMAMV